MYKHEILFTPISNIKNLEHHFTVMAAKGWIIDRMGILNRYKAIEPCKLCFHVGIVPQIDFKCDPYSAEMIEHRKICEDLGWRFITSRGYIRVFCSTDDKTEQITLNNSLQNENYIKLYIKHKFYLHILISLFILFIVLLPFLLLGNPSVDRLLSNANVSMIIGMPIVFLA